jgi:hypothetical protein
MSNHGSSARVCPVCGAAPVEQKMKLVCPRCRTILETCCEGGPVFGGSVGGAPQNEPARNSPPTPSNGGRGRS